MRRRYLYAALGAEAAGCLALALLRRPDEAALTALAGFPFQPLGRLLRRMSLSGGAGNAAAVALYALACLLPAGYLAARLIRRRARWEDGLLAALSGVLFPLLYWAVNPALLPAGMGAFGLVFAGGVFWSVAAGYLALRALRACRTAEGTRLRRYGAAMLAALAALSVFGAFGASPLALMRSVRQVQAENTGGGAALGLTYLLLGLRCAVSAAAYLMDLLAVFAGLDLLAAWDGGPYSARAVAAAETLTRRCARALTFTALAGAALALAQLLGAGRLHAAAVTVYVPVLPMGLTLAALLLAQYMREGKALKDDNDLFI